MLPNKAQPLATVAVSEAKYELSRGISQVVFLGNGALETPVFGGFKRGTRPLLRLAPVLPTAFQLIFGER